MIFKRREHPLPKFPPDVIDTFRGLCEELDDELIPELLPAVTNAVNEFRLLSVKHTHIDLQLAERIANVCEELLKDYSSYEPNHKKLVIGAIRYFADSDDSLSETTFASGFDDDVKVMNHVLEELGRDDLYIELD